jgi:hypothetical protein
MVTVSQAGELDEVTDHALRSIASKHFDGEIYSVETADDGGLTTKRGNMSRDIAAMLLAHERISGLPEIATVSKCPVVYEVAPGEPAVHREGYLDRADGVFVVGGASDEVELGEAIKIIEDLFVDFLFSSEADKTRAIAMLITPALVQGGFVRDRIPADSAEADCSQAGKGYRHDIVVNVYGDTVAIVTQRFGGTGSLDEFFGGALLSGKSFIRLDNLRGKLDSPSIESFFTTPYGGYFKARGFRCDGLVQAGRNILQVSANSMEGTPDIANRMCIVRIRKQPEGYEFTPFPEGDLLEHIKANQGRFLGAVHAVVKEWIRRGKPRSTETRHDFRKWAQTLDWIMTNIFNRSGMLDGHRELQNRVASSTVSKLRSLAIAIDKDGRLGEDFGASQIVELADQYDIDFELRGKDVDAKAKNFGGKMKSLFKEAAKATETLFREHEANVIRIDEYEFVRWVEQVARQDGKGYYDTKLYRFRKP